MLLLLFVKHRMRNRDFLQILPWQLSDYFAVYDESELIQCLHVNIDVDDSQRFVFISISHFCFLISVHSVELNSDFT